MPTREAPDHDHPDYRRTMHWYYPFAPSALHLVRAWKRQAELRTAWTDDDLDPSSPRTTHCLLWEDC